MTNSSIISLCASALLLFTGCSGHTLQDWADEEFNNKHAVASAENSADLPNPSQNPQLNAVSPSPTATSEGGAMQKGLDEWVEKEWTPTVEQNETIKAMNQDKNRDFKLQEYVDKAMIYHENKPKSGTPSHYEKLEQLPAIGK